MRPLAQRVGGRITARWNIAKERLKDEGVGVERSHTQVAREGLDLLRDPVLNKGSGFPEEERKAFRLEGLLPPCVQSLEEQVQSAYTSMGQCGTPFDRWWFLSDLQDRNETLFYALAKRHLQEILPLIYTPMIGEAAQRFSLVYRRPRGLILHPGLRGRLRQILSQHVSREVKIIVATDGERVLGLGDQGLGGMMISVGKTALYTLVAGISPRETLPISLDVGTNHAGLLSDPHYIGWRHPRLTGQEYDSFVEEFVEAVRAICPHTLLQWEDFGRDNARRVLETYQKKVLSFNDDIQGTSAVTLGGLLSACRVAGQNLAEQNIVIFGAGSAGLGIAERIIGWHVRHGGDEQGIQRRIYLFDRRGLVIEGHPTYSPLQQVLAKSLGEVSTWKVADPNHISLEEVLAHTKASVLIGVSAQANGFSRQAITTMARSCARPVIFPLSNPTSKSEAIPEDLLHWTEGRALIATGSPFPPVSYGGRLIQIGQCNNLYIFPGIGLGALIAEATEVTDRMFDQAALVLAEHSPAAEHPDGALLPSLDQAAELATTLALQVARAAMADGVAPQVSDAVLMERMQRLQWRPEYRSFRPR